MSRGFVAALIEFAAQGEIPLVQFRKGERKDTVMAEHLRLRRDNEAASVASIRMRMPMAWNAGRA
jgi:hypothetical protein